MTDLAMAEAAVQRVRLLALRCELAGGLLAPGEVLEAIDPAPAAVFGGVAAAVHGAATDHFVQVLHGGGWVCTQCPASGPGAPRPAVEAGLRVAS